MNPTGTPDRTLLETALERLSPAHRYFTTLGSSMDTAREWAEAGAPDGAVVLADEQTSGRGRLERTWVTRAGAALAISIIFKPLPEELDHLGLFSPLGALAVSAALEKCGLRPEVKWPNDVLVSGRKISGVLAEAHWLAGELQSVVLGIGINITSAAVPPPAELFFPAASLEERLGYSPERVAILEDVIDNVYKLRPTLGSANFLRAWQERLAFRGQSVMVEQPHQASITGRAAGITPQGCLLLQLENGSEIEIPAGDVKLRPIPS